MNKLFRKTRGQSRTTASNDDQAESSDAEQPQSGGNAVTAGTSSDAFDVVLRLEVPSVPKLRSSSIDASCLHQGEMNDVGVTAAYGGGVGGRENISPTGSDASSIDRETGATTLSVGSSLLRVDLPKCFRRRSFDVPRLCIHCVHLEAMAASTGGRDDGSGLFSFAAGDMTGQDSRCSSPSDADIDAESTSDDEDLPGNGTSDYRPPLPVAAAFEMSCVESSPPRTLAWHHQQQMLLTDHPNKLYQTSSDSQSFPVVMTATSEDITCGETDSVNERASSGGGSNRSSVGSGDGCTAGGPGGDWKEIVTLQVPLIKPRSSSLDVTYYASTLRPPDADGDDDRRCSCENLAVPDAAKHRSTSVDVSLPTDASGGSYRAITCYAADSNK